MSKRIDLVKKIDFAACKLNQIFKHIGIHSGTSFLSYLAAA